MLINTHHHGDHTGGNKAFRPLVKSIVCQENCLAWHKKVSEEAKNVADQAFADVSFGGSWSTNFGDEKVWARYFGPGHTSGDAVIHFEKANVVHGGDLLFRRVHPRIDGPAGASAVNWIKVLERMAKDHGNDTIFVFGHGADNNVRGNKTDVLFFRDYLSAGVDHVRKGISAKKSKDEITKIAALPKFESVITFNPRLTPRSNTGIDLRRVIEVTIRDQGSDRDQDITMTPIRTAATALVLSFATAALGRTGAGAAHADHDREVVRHGAAGSAVVPGDRPGHAVWPG